ncbi:MAG: glutamine synthetase [Candidatus Competibacterales bacterium]
MSDLQREPMVMVGTCDLGGRVRGRGFPARQLPHRLEQGVGWAPTKTMITAFDTLADGPWGAFGDLLLIPDPEAEVPLVTVAGQPPPRFFLADIIHPDGAPWECCPRHFLRRALGALEALGGLQLQAAFEHEFYCPDADYKGNAGYGFGAWYRSGPFLETLAHALQQGGVEPEGLMPEFGAGQWEVNCAPALGLKAADRAVAVREIVRAAARAMGRTVSFAPLVAPDASGNGAHIHLSLLDAAGQPITYAADAPHYINPQVASFFAGILHYLPSMVALTAPSAVSYLRLMPHRFSAYYNNLGYRQREAALRICPVATPPKAKAPPLQFNLEYRVADAAASPHMALATLVWAGVAGLQRQLPLPEPTTETFDTLSATEKQQLGLVRLPQSLGSALTQLERFEEASSWLGHGLLGAYLANKRAELAVVGHLEARQQCARYREIY